MTNRWLILAVLFLARLAMAFQFQAIAALSPLISRDFGIGLADIGLLIGLYLAPGVVFAIPGGAIATRFGDKRVVFLAMCLMLVGGVLISLSPDWNAFILGRIVAGTGAVVLNILLTKMVVDWFADKEISTAMAITVNSWPVGIALALVVLPWAAAVGGMGAALWTVNAIVAAGLLLFAVFYRAPEESVPANAHVKVAAFPVFALTLAGLIWALYNSALAMVFSFGPALFVQKGWSLDEAGGITSAFMIAFSIALPLGGIVADRMQARDAVIFVSLAGFAALVPMVLYAPTPLVLPAFLAAALFFALAAGPIMTLPSAVLSPQARAFGMGVFFSIYYAVMMIAPRLAGIAADRSGDVGLAFLLGALMSVACILALWVFRRSLIRLATA